MSSKIDPSGINPAYPVASTNQSSQGFRDNFKAIQNALVQAKTENTLILGTTITVSGDGIDDFTSTSIEVGNGNIPLEINLTSQENVSAASYNTLTDILAFTVNQQGILTSLAKQPSLPVINTTSLWKITRAPNDASYPNQNGILSVTYPTIQTNDAGRVISAGSVTISNIGLLGYSMNKGQILVGSSSNLSTYLPVGLDNQVLVANSGSPSGLSWTTPTNGTVTNVRTGLGLLVNNSNVTPEIDLDIQALPDNNTFDDSLIFLTYSHNHSTTKWSNIKTQLAQSISQVGYLKAVQDDLSPKLGADLNTNGHNIITDGSSGLTISTGTQGLTLKTTGTLSSTATAISLSSPSTKINGITVPGNLSSKNNIILMANTDGVLYWQALTSVSSITGDSAIIANTTGTTVALEFEPWGLPSLTANSNTKILGVDNSANTSGLLDMSAVVQGASLAPGVLFVSPQGNDTSGNGSIMAPYRTITKANTAGFNICLLPGTYPETLTTSNLTGLSVLIANSVTLSGTVTLGAGGANYGGIIFSGAVSITGSSIFNNCNFQSNITSTGGSTFYGCEFSGNITNSNSMMMNNCISTSGCTITSSSNIEACNCSGLTFTHTDGIMELYNVVYCGGVTSTATGSAASLIMRNVSLSNNDGTWNVLNKTGTCSYIIQNVSRLPTQDTLAGMRLEFSNTDDDIGSVVKTDSITGSYVITSNNRYYDLTVNTSSPSITINVDSFDSSKYSRELTVILRGTTTSQGGTLTWQNVTWSTGNSPKWNSANGSITVYKFTYANSTGWIGTVISDLQIPLDPDSNNLLQKTNNGYLVELKAAPDVTNQYVSSSTGDDTTGNGSQANPFKTIRRALNRIPDHTQVWIHLYSGDTFDFTDGVDGYVENGTLQQVVHGNFYVGSRNITFLPYNNTIYDSLPSGVADDSPNIGTQPLIRFTYSKTSDTAEYTCAGFALSSGSLYFHQISFTVKSDNLPSTSTTADWAAPFTINDGTLTTFGCNFNLSNGVVIGADGGNESSGSVVLGATNYYNTTNGTALMDARCGYTLRAPFGDITGGNNIIINGKDTGMTQKAGNFNASVANSNSFLYLNVINADARIYAGLTTQNKLS